MGHDLFILLKINLQKSGCVSMNSVVVESNLICTVMGRSVLSSVHQLIDLVFVFKIYPVLMALSAAPLVIFIHILCM